MADDLNKKPDKTKTMPLSPAVGVRFAWALTGGFVDSPDSKRTAARAEEELKDILAVAKQERAKHPKGYAYVTAATAAIQAAVRSLEVIYRGRNLNFEENQKLREVYLESARDMADFGAKFRDFAKTLPTATVAVAGGTATLGSVFGLTGIQLWAVGGLLAAVGIAGHSLVVEYVRDYRRRQYVASDYERNVYYGQYVDRVCMTLEALYNDLRRAYEEHFGRRYADPTGKSACDIAKDTIKGTEPTMCQYVHEHYRSRVITPELWHLCETGTVQKDCPEWRRQRGEHVRTNPDWYQVIWRVGLALIMAIGLSIVGVVVARAQSQKAEAHQEPEQAALQDAEQEGPAAAESIPQTP